MRNIPMLLSLIVLSACQAPPLPTSYMEPSKQAYQGFEDDFYLKGKIQLGSIQTILPEQQKEQFSLLPSVLDSSLRRANFTAADGKAAYALNAELKEVKGSCQFTVCESGSTIHYSLVNMKTQQIKYDELVVVPFTNDYPGFMCVMFGCNQLEYLNKSYGGAIAENVAHVMRALSMKTQAELK